MLEKGVWTWLQIHVGSHLGLFDRTTINLDRIAQFALSQNFTEVEADDFYRTLDYKAVRWKLRHPESPIQMRTPEPNQIPVNPGRFAVWIQRTENEIEADFINSLIPRGCMTNIFSWKRDEEIVVILSVDQLKTPSSKIPNLPQLAAFLNGTSAIGQEEFNHFLSTDKKVYIFFTQTFIRFETRPSFFS